MPLNTCTNEELIHEIEILRKRISELESLNPNTKLVFPPVESSKYVRVLDRKTLFVEVPIHVKNCPSNCGTVLNMTVKGLGVRGIRCNVRELLTLEICPPETLNLANFSLEAVCRWTHHEESDGEQYSGLEITRISELDISNLCSLLIVLGHEYLRDQFRRKKGEEALKLIDASSDLMCRFTDDGVITFVNKAFCKFCELSTDSLLGLKFETFVPEDSRAGFREFLKAHSIDDYHGFYECHIVTASGDSRLHMWTVDAHFDRDKDKIEIQFVGRDITEPRRMEQDLRNSHFELERSIKDRTSQLELVNIKLSEEIKQRKRIEEALDKKLWALTRPDLDIRDIGLTDLIDFNTLHKIQDSFSDLLNMPVELIAATGKPITIPRNVSDFYTKVRSTEEGRRLIEKKDSDIIAKAGSEIILLYESFLLTDESSYIIPINIQGHNIGAWKIGQSFEKEPIPEEINQLGFHIKVDPDELLNSVKSSPRISRNRLIKAANFLSLLSSQVSMLGLQNLSQARIIHELNVAQASIKRSEQKLRNLLESAPVGIFITNQGIISFANNALSLMYGFSSTSEMEGLSISSFLKDRTMPEPFLNLEESDDSSTIEYSSLQAVRKDGLLFDVSLYCSKMSLESESALIGFVIDKTQENALRSQLLHAQKMEALGTLAGGIAHDFNNVLTIIMGYAEIALTEIARNQVVTSQLNQILEASKRARDLVSQILTFSRKGEHQRKPLNVVPIIKETVKFLAASLPAIIHIQSKIQTEDKMILGDPSQIHQVLMNLCSNAGYAMRRTGGTLEINLDVITIKSPRLFGVSTLETGDYLRLTVRDSGPGIDPKIMDRVFEPYFTTKPPGEGSGLGLAVVHGIVSSHGGIIRIDETYNNGACFEVYFPIIAPEKVPEENESESNLQGNQKILFVDDEKYVSDVAKEMLEALGYTVVAYTNPITALNMFRICSYDFDLVITDLTMKEMTGLILAQEIKKIRPEISVVLITGYDAENEISGENLNLVKEIVQKPFTNKTLGRAVKDALQGFPKTLE